MDQEHDPVISVRADDGREDLKTGTAGRCGEVRSASEPSAVVPPFAARSTRATTRSLGFRVVVARVRS